MVSRLTEINGLDVYTEDGKRVGVVEDVSIDPDTGKVLAIAVGRVSEEFLDKIGVSEGRGVLVPYEGIKSVGSIVLMKSLPYTVKEV